MSAGLLTTPLGWAYDLTWTYIRHSYDIQEVMWESYIRSLVLICPFKQCFHCYNWTCLWILVLYRNSPSQVFYKISFMKNSQIHSKNICDWGLDCNESGKLFICFSICFSVLLYIVIKWKYFEGVLVKEKKWLKFVAVITRRKHMAFYSHISCLIH